MPNQLSPSPVENLADMEQNELQKLRVKIDGLDAQLLSLLSQRARLVDQVGAYKKAKGIQPLDPQRWEQVLNAQKQRATEMGLWPEFIDELYHLIHDYSLKLESESTIPTHEVGQSAPVAVESGKAITQIGIQGGEGSFNEEAVRYYLNLHPRLNHQIHYLYTSPGVMEALLRGEIDRGQCAIYNSVGGYVEETTDALAQYKVKIIEEFEIKIAHALMIRADQEFEQIDTICCHPQVLAQCHGTLQRKYPHLKQTSGEGEWVDNAKTAEALATRRLPDNVAVMGSKVLAKIYNLNVVEDNLQDATENFTRFIHVIRG